MRKYSPQVIEKKWQKEWVKNNYKNWKAKDFSKHRKLYLLVEFPYPSGDGLHVGHCRSYAALDILARKKRMEGYNVLYPMGWDAFGLPTENYAIKKGVHPAIITKRNVAIFKKQLKNMGFSFDWSREINTTDPKYYKWTQWIFLQFFKRGLAYQAEMPINWCPSCKIGLANEEVIDNKCERCGAETEKRKIKQWMLKITQYAERLIKDLEKVDYLEKIKTQQINWIGKSEGALIKFPIVGDDGNVGNVGDVHFQQAKRSNKRSDPTVQTYLEVFTTRLDTIFGCTYCVVAPEHKIIQNLEYRILNIEEIKNYINEAKKKTDIERTMAWEKVPPQSGEDARISNQIEDLEKFGNKTGVEIKGIKAINPFANEEAPIFVADYVLGHYGTGAVMAVPAHDERDFAFAKKYRLPIRKVVLPKPLLLIARNAEDVAVGARNILRVEAECFIEDGELINSGQFTGLISGEARKKMIEWLEKNNLGGEKINYKLRDWIFSRQHYWGEPIPLVFCPACKKQAQTYTDSTQTNADQFLRKSALSRRNSAKFTAGELINPGWIAVPEKDLPVILPNVKNYKPTDTGESPLAKITGWVNVKCPKCKGQAKRETDTMPNWAGSSWYYLAYLLGNQKSKSKNQKYVWDKKKINYWMPVDLYNGGMEHTTLHLLYSRFWHKFLYDLKLVKGPEPYQKRISHGMVLGEGGIKMSKSKGNVVNPDEQIKKYGADSLRLYEMFMGPFDEAIPWDPRGIVGMKRWLERIWKLSSKFVPNPKSEIRNSKQISNLNFQNSKSEKLLHKAIKKVSEDIENFRFNTAISAMMILTNEMEKEKEIPQDIYSKFLIILSVFAPHLCEELWLMLGCKKSIQLEPWPKYDPKLIKEETFELVVQINGKVRDKFEVATDIFEEEAKILTLARPSVRMWLKEKSARKIIFVPNKLINIVV